MRPPTAPSHSAGSPLTPFVYAAVITVAVLIAGALVFASRYRALIEIDAATTQLSRFEGVILRLDEVLSMSARMAAATGDPQWEARYHRYDRQFDDAIDEAAALEPAVGQALAKAISAIDEAIDARENRAFELDRAGRRAEASALFDAEYERLKEDRARGVHDLMTGIGAANAARLEAHERSVTAVMGAGAAALGFLTLLWVHMLRLIRRYIRDRRSAEAELREAHATLEARVEDRTREVAASREQYRSLVENTAAIPFEWDAVAHRMVYLAPQAAQLFGHPIDELHGAGFLARVLHDQSRTRSGDETGDAIEHFLAGAGGTLDCRMVTAAGRAIYVRMVLGARGPGDPARGVMLDVTQQKQLEGELQQAQKLESIGRLTAGIAHEINTPVQFVRDSVQFARESMPELMTVIDGHRKVTAAVAAGEPALELARAAQATDDTADMAYLTEHVPDALDRALDGLVRIATIIRAMKVYSHPRKERGPVDLNDSIASTLEIARSEYKYVADVETRFAELPPVNCFAGELNQVVLNLVTNAAHAIGDVVAGTTQRGRITVATRRDGDDVVIAIGDTGTGIPPAVRPRLFEPFFTTKDVGKGTGQGLSHARTVVVDHHGGSLTFDTEVGAGTTFYIRIPIAAAGPGELAA